MIYNLCQKKGVDLPTYSITGLCIKPEIVAAKVDVISESDDVMLIKVTCYSEYILDGSKFIKCQEGSWRYDFPICTSRFLPKLVLN